MKTYEIWDEGSSETIEAEDIEDAKEQARDWLRGGEWGEVVETIWVHAEIASEDDEETASVTVAIDPDEPPCDGDEHDWQSPHDIVGGCEENPGVWGHGGGVFITEVCLRCGCKKVTDTWAQDPSNGRQGLTSVSYEPGAYSEELAERDTN